MQARLELGTGEAVLGYRSEGNTVGGKRGAEDCAGLAQVFSPLKLRWPAQHVFAEKWSQSLPAGNRTLVTRSLARQSS